MQSKKKRKKSVLNCVDNLEQLSKRERENIKFIISNTTELCQLISNIPKMHIEIQVALNFVISYLYNKLPRRRVNIFGEEMEKALKHKFQGHWYPDKPFKVSFCCFYLIYRFFCLLFPFVLN